MFSNVYIIMFNSQQSNPKYYNYILVSSCSAEAQRIAIALPARPDGSCLPAETRNFESGQSCADVPFE